MAHTKPRSSINVTPEFRLRIASLRVIRREPYEDVIRRLLDFWEAAHPKAPPTAQPVAAEASS